MAKKKKIIDLRHKEITFEVEKRTYQALSYDTQGQTIEVLTFENNLKIGIEKIPFAHIPRSVKQKIKPLS